MLTWHDAMRELAGVDLGSRLSLAKLLHNERLPDSVGVADVGGQPAVGVVQLLLPQVVAVRVVEGLVDLAPSKVCIPARKAWQVLASSQVQRGLPARKLTATHQQEVTRQFR